MSLDQARGRDFLVLTKRSAASGDENDSSENSRTLIDYLGEAFSVELQLFNCNGFSGAYAEYCNIYTVNETGFPFI